MHRLLFLLAFVFGICMFAHGQVTPAQADSLEAILKKPAGNIERAVILNKLATYYWQTNPKQSLALIKTGLALPLPDSLQRDLHETMAVAYAILAITDSSFLHYHQALDLSWVLHDTVRIVRTNTNLANTYWVQGQVETSLATLLETIALFDSKKLKPQQKAGTYGTLGVVYSLLANHDLALHYDSLAIDMLIDVPSRRTTLNTIKSNMANHLIDAGKPEKAEVVLKEVIVLEKELGRALILGNSYVTYSLLMGKLNRIDEAYESLSEALAIFQKGNFAREEAQALSELSGIEFKRKHFESAEQLAQKGLKQSEDVKDWTGQKNATFTLMQVALVKQKFDDAARYELKYRVASDSVVKGKNVEATTAMRIKFDTQQKEKENEILKRDQLINESKLRTRNALLIMGAAIVVLLGTLLFISMRLRNKIKKVNLALKRRNLEIERKNMEISKQNNVLEHTLRELNETQLQLIHSEKMASLGQFTAGIAHEINNPLNFIMGGLQGITHTLKNADSVPHTELSQDLGDLIAPLEKGAFRVKKIVDSMLAITRHSLNDISSCDLAENMKLALMLVSTMPEMKNITINMATENAPVVECNAGEINQVFINLLTNAVHATQGAGMIGIIFLLDHHGHAVVKVKDNGKGIRPEDLPKIYDPFFTTKPAGQGTGLGLSICRKIIERHSGTMKIESTFSVGTTVTITLPVVQHQLM
ncbi:tetratricopeptide repeat-containing sensor histidine kinase [Chryseolinea lacunae]|uniref:histidine kinase n=1 Tax=Chryseolinea lacunae TaxID=2801331 RepID=A0ABS1KL61_9BACT|nr:ATP-binding protein [Chryseolinea lacunae]MBL0740200.1 tetratricopeptide repeat-containing sensor histidine kinase [Chryseolinea lacunae]